MYASIKKISLKIISLLKIRAGDKNRLHGHRISFSQEGEDLVIDRYFEEVTSGFYVDVGAHDPKRFSNTYLFYLKGWTGINIDAMPGSMDKFKEMRPNDVNLEIGVSDKGGKRELFLFSEPALNTMDEVTAKKRIEKGFKFEKSIKVKVDTIESILDRYLPSNQQIDFMSIDIEGLDYKALSSNNWKKYKPKIVIVELLKTQSIEDVLNSNECKLLKNEGYLCVAKTHNSVFFKFI